MVYVKEGGYNMSEISVVKDNKLSGKYDERYVVIDKDTGKVLDDAQGYGYKSTQAAYAAWSYKHRDKTKDKEKRLKEMQIRNWMKQNKSFVKLMDELNFEICKGSYGPDDKFDAKFVKKLLKEHGLSVPFTPGELLKVYRKR
jgi:hypothetical protein